MTKQAILSQLGRFARLTATAFIASGVIPTFVSGSGNRQVLIAAVVGAVEVAYRAMRPTLPTTHIAKAVSEGVKDFIVHAIEHRLHAEKLAAAIEVIASEGSGFASAGALPAAQPVQATPPALPAPTPPAESLSAPVVDVTTLPAPPPPAPAEVVPPVAPPVNVT